MSALSFAELTGVWVERSIAVGRARRSAHPEDMRERSIKQPQYVGKDAVFLLLRKVCVRGATEKPAPQHNGRVSVNATH